MTIAEQLNHDFSKGPLILYDVNKNEIYYERSYMKYWEKREFDSNKNCIYYEDSKGFWYKREYDANNNQIYFEDSDGYIEDNRSKQKA